MLKIRFWVILLLLVLVSYGQILFMYVWQDDNALFFKLANIEGRAGYLGMGIPNLFDIWFCDAAIFFVGFNVLFTRDVVCLLDNKKDL